MSSKYLLPFCQLVWGRQSEPGKGLLASQGRAGKAPGLACGALLNGNLKNDIVFGSANDILTEGGLGSAQTLCLIGFAQNLCFIRFAQVTAVCSIAKFAK